MQMTTLGVPALSALLNPTRSGATPLPPHSDAQPAESDGPSPTAFPYRRLQDSPPYLSCRSPPVSQIICSIPAFLASLSGEGKRNGSFMREEPLTRLSPPERWITLGTEPGQRAWNFNEFIGSQDIALTERPRWLTGQWITCS
ncbi:hypothetical protein BDR22DRAFT_614475 [Usnea florida]